MNFLRPGTKLYDILQLLLRIIIVNIIFLGSLCTIIGISYGLQIIKEYISARSIKTFIAQTSFKHILLSFLMSLLSLLIAYLGFLNFAFLQENYLRFAYLFLYACILLIVLITNMFFDLLLKKEIKLSHIIATCFLNYPKFVFFFSIISGMAFLLSQNEWLFAVILCYAGATIYLAYKCVYLHISTLLKS